MTEAQEGKKGARPHSVCRHGSLRRKCESCERDVMAQVLDDAGLSLRMGDLNRLMKCIFVWEQRATHLLSGAETWEDQRIGPARLGGIPPDNADSGGG